MWMESLRHVYIHARLTVLISPSRVALAYPRSCRTQTHTHTQTHASTHNSLSFSHARTLTHTLSPCLPFSFSLVHTSGSCEGQTDPNARWLNLPDCHTPFSSLPTRAQPNSLLPASQDSKSRQGAWCRPRRAGHLPPWKPNTLLPPTYLTSPVSRLTPVPTSGLTPMGRNREPHRKGALGTLILPCRLEVGPSCLGSG
ncbi:hypothetical protein B0T24DRAFT_24522 [Lasiosphaeria ovina]|uniref:Uncharacterized protein n=1 Tax=Lasiosphaeria ovina TaxID=92902 RepID=A0AAE0NJR2_9PEZI|nr:hypothetical protein B0T24DRAFT_24522 [Lasiosphaeria ovina]